MRKLVGLALLIGCAQFAAAAWKPIARVSLPCDSAFQVLSPTGSQLVVQCKDKSLQWVGVPDGTAQSIVPAGGGVSTFVFSPDGRWLAVGFNDGSVDLLDSSGKAAGRHWQADPHRIDLLYFLPDAGKLFAGPVDSPGQVWDITGTPTLRASLPAEFGGVPACAASPDGKWFVAAGDDTVLRWYDTANWQKAREYRDFLLETFALAFTSDSKQLLAGGADSRITIFDVASGRPVQQLAPQPGSFIGLMSLVGDQRVATVYFDDAGEKPPHALLWNLTTAKPESLDSDVPQTCGGVVGSRLWVCTTDKRSVTLSQYQ